MDTKGCPLFCAAWQTIQEWIKLFELHCQAHKYEDDKKATWCRLTIGPEAEAFLANFPDDIWIRLQRRLIKNLGTTQPHDKALSRLLNLIWG